jgi:hypothetical protein
MRRSIVWLLCCALPASVFGSGAQVNVCSVPQITPDKPTICAGGSQQFEAKPTGGSPFPPNAPKWSMTVLSSSCAGTLQLTPDTGTLTTFSSPGSFCGEVEIVATCDTSSSKTTVQVVTVEVNPAAPTIDGVDSGNFSISVTPSTVTVSSYNWQWTAPSGAGNSPQVTFSSNTGSITTAVNSRWFALPDDRVQASTSCRYTVNCEVSIGTTKCTDPNPLQWTVYVPDPAAQTIWPEIMGMPTIDVRVVNGANEWYVVDIGSLHRRAPVVVPFIPMTSQFYNKIVTVHEGRHVTQFTTAVPGLTVHTLWDHAELYNNVLRTMTSTVNDQDLRDRIREQIDTQNAIDNADAQSQRPLAELDAHTISNGVPPHYLEPF